MPLPIEAEEPPVELLPSWSLILVEELLEVLFLDDFPDLPLPVDLLEVEPLALALGVEVDLLPLLFLPEVLSELEEAVGLEVLFLEPEVVLLVKPVDSDRREPELPNPLPPVSPDWLVVEPEIPVDCVEPSEASEFELLPMLPEEEALEPDVLLAPEVAPMLPFC
jgi:hypothetical protein